MGGRRQEFDGSLDDYRANVLACAQAQGANDRKSAKPEGRKPDRNSAAQARERHQALRKQASQAEGELNRLWKRRAEIDALLAAPHGNSGPLSSRADEDPGRNRTQPCDRRTSLARGERGGGTRKARGAGLAAGIGSKSASVRQAPMPVKSIVGVGRAGRFHRIWPIHYRLPMLRLHGITRGARVEAGTASAKSRKERSGARHEFSKRHHRTACHCRHGRL